MSAALTVPMLAGCAVHVTKAQADSVDAFYECRFEGRIAANIELERVEADGGVLLRSMDSAAGIREALACWEEKMRARGYRDFERIG